MSLNRNNFDLKNKNEHYFKLIKNNIHNYKLSLKNHHNFSFSIFGFTVSRSIYVRIKDTIKTTIDFLLKLKFKIKLDYTINTISNFKSNKKIFASTKDNINSILKFVSFKKIKPNNINFTIKIGKITNLFVLDEKFLSELDDKNLNYLDAIEGLTLKYAMKLFGNIKDTINMNINMSLFKLNRLNSFDDLFLLDIDDQNLKELDVTRLS